MNVADLIAENQKRREALDQPYDPYAGIGSPLERLPVPLGFVVRTPLRTETGTIHVPASMAPTAAAITEAGSLTAFAAAHELSPEAALEQFNAIRFQHDFEFWCASVARIKDKRGKVVPFILNRPQRLYLADMEAQRLAGEPVRQLVLKHRQWGCTTLSYTYIAWHQIELFTGRDAWFVGLDAAGAEDVRQRYDVIREACSALGKPLHVRNYDRGGTTRIMPERDARISIGMVSRPNAPSGRPAQFIHLFEVGKWPSNSVVSAEKVVQNMDAMLPDEPGTVSIIESTAQASTGTYFMHLCREAQKGAVGTRFLFVAWYDDPYCRTALDKEDTDALAAEIATVSAERMEAADKGEHPPDSPEYAAELWALGASLEHIAWYREQARKPGYVLEPWRLKEEFPSTAEEAFQTGGRRIFPITYVQEVRAACKPPALVGELFADGQAGRPALQGIRFEADARGHLSIWRKPGDTYGGLLRYPRVAHRYCAAADVGGKWKGADFSDLVVFDRAPMLFGGFPTVAAEWHGHIDHDLFAWICARIAMWYDRALLAVEVNTLLEDNETRYDPGKTVLDEIIGFYPNLYQRQVRDAVTLQVTNKVGFHMNVSTKETVITALKRGLRDFYEHRRQGKPGAFAYIERCREACDEMDIYLLHDDGSMGATSRSERSNERKKDDRVVTRAIAKWLSDSMPPPSYITRSEEDGKGSEVTKPSMAGF